MEKKQVGRPPGGKRLGGRAKGTPNKINKEVREIIKDIASDYFNNGEFTKDFKKLSPKDKIMAMEKVMKFAIPTLSSVDAKVYTNQQLEDKVKNMTDDQFFTLVDMAMGINEDDDEE
ncbi:MULTISPECIES: hypothetical protein [Sphingobacterium]|uniref:DUF5681 domain-containing protein n=1 Tax=Sphingobacterium tenebrionis TaxID=3111775 RepID=A0ABU8I3Z5_9SPHI|nr:hypothetical protein [Sphingobacterium sp. CZ-2]QBR11482.1 hypothetical protein E3D81_04550 [Sphingobacterium sp. CZ-2]